MDDTDGSLGYGTVDQLPAAQPWQPASPERGVAPALEAQGYGPLLDSQPRVPGAMEHQGFRSPVPIHDVYQHQGMPRPMRHGPPTYNGSPELAQAIGTVPPMTRSRLGLSLAALVVGAGAGGYLGGIPGAGAGVLLAGSGLNAIRSFSRYQDGTPESDREAGVSAIFSVLGAAAGGYVWWRFVHERGYRRNPEGDDGGDEDETDLYDPPGKCDIRPV